MEGKKNVKFLVAALLVVMIIGAGYLGANSGYLQGKMSSHISDLPKFLKEAKAALDVATQDLAVKEVAWDTAKAAKNAAMDLMSEKDMAVVQAAGAVQAAEASYDLASAKLAKANAAIDSFRASGSTDVAWKKRLVNLSKEAKLAYANATNVLKIAKESKAVADSEVAQAKTAYEAAKLVNTDAHAAFNSAFEVWDAAKMKYDLLNAEVQKAKDAEKTKK